MTAKLEKTNVTIGFIPLTDCALIAVAQERGFFAKHGVTVTLSREPSWASLRDKMMFGALDGAHMLAPMLVAATLGLGTAPFPMVTALSLGLNGNAVTFSKALHAEMAAIYPSYAKQRPVSAMALRGVIAERKRTGKPLVTLAMVFPFSMHNYLVRYWLAAAGIHPDRDLRLIVMPPPQMGAALAAGTIDGFCSGGPWNQVAVQAHAGEVVVTGYEIWNNAPEKVFGVSDTWAQENPNTHRALIMAMIEAAQWLETSANLAETAKLLAAPAYVGVSTDLIEPSLRGKWHYRADQPAADIPDYHVFHRYAANFPWISHGVWILTQMCRWGQLPMRTDFAEIALAIYRPDLYRTAAAALGVAAPSSDFKPEGLHGSPWVLDGPARGADRFFDGRAFDPFRPLAYLEGFELHSMRTASPVLALAT